MFHPKQADEVLCVAALLQGLGRSIDLDSVEDAVLSRPSHPSLLAISEALTELGVAHDPLGADPESLDELARPHIAHLTAGAFVTVVDVSAEAVTLSAKPRHRRVLSRAEYVSLWSGAVLVPTGASERHVSRNRPPRIPTLALLLGMALSLAGAAGAGMLTALPAWTWGALLVMKVLGLVISVSLLSEEFGLHSSARRFCQMGRSASCSAVMNSPAGRIGPLSMADIGFGYFCGGLFALVVAPSLSQGIHATMSVLRALNLVALPYTVFSIGYQAFVIRRWCPLCMAVQGLLWMEALASATVPLAVHGPQVPAGFMAVILLPLPMFVWLAVKPLAKRALEFRPLGFMLARLQNSPEVIQAMLQAQPSVLLPTAGLEIAYGPESARLMITIYSAPDCPHCRSAHAMLTEAMAAAPGLIRVVVRLQLPMGKGADAERLVVTLAELLATTRHGEAALLLQRWYEQSSQPEELIDRSRVCERAREMLARLDEERKTPPFHGVPVIFVGDRQWPEQLPRSGIKHLARAMAQADS